MIFFPTEAMQRGHITRDEARTLFGELAQAMFHHQRSPSTCYPEQNATVYVVDGDLRITIQKVAA